MFLGIAILCLVPVFGMEVSRGSRLYVSQAKASAETTTSSSSQTDSPDKMAALSEPANCSITGVYVNCSNLGLQSIPSNLPVNAEFIDFTNNSLSEIPARAFENFHRLVSLDFTNNSINVLNESAFEGLRNLRDLHLRQNKLNVTALTARVLEPLASSLTLLTLDGNAAARAESLTYPEAALASLQALQELHLDAVGRLVLGSSFSRLENLTCLSFSGQHGTCRVPTLYNDTFQNVPQLRVLELVACQVRYIEPLAFQPLCGIDTLDLSDNRNLGFKGVTIASYGLQQSKIKVLKLNYIHHRFATCVKIMKCHFQFLRNTELEEVQLDGNNIEIIERGTLALVPKSLKVVSARFNDFTFGSYMLDFGELANLTSLDLSQAHRTHHLPRIDSETMENNTWQDPCPQLPFLPSLDTEAPPGLDSLYEDSDVGDDIVEPFSVPLPPNLRTVNFRWNVLFFDITEVNMSANNLEELDLSYNLFSVWNGPVYGLENLKRLIISNNLASWMDKMAFQHFPSLEYLDLGYNRLRGITSEKTEQRLFENLTSLKVFNLSYNELYSLNETSLYGLDSLEVLNASHNKLVVENFRVDISHMKNLSVVDFSRNNLNLLPPYFCRALDKLVETGPTRVQLDLSSNPIVCSCEPGNLLFLTWLSTTKVNLTNRGEYFCLFPNGTTGDLWGNLDAVRFSCNNYLALALGCFSIVFVVIGLSVGLVTYRLRWKLRYLYITARGSRQNPEYEGLETFEYDAFVMHDDDDTCFVREMVQKLETEGITLLPSYALTAGKLLLKSTVEGIQSSRRTLFIVSTNFFENNFLDYGLQMAIQESLYTKRDVVLILLYDPVQARSLSRQVLYYIQSGAFVEFPQDERCLPFFWDNLTAALQARRRHKSSASLSSSSSSQALAHS